MDHTHTTDLNFQQSWLHQERNRMQQPTATIANMEGSRTDERHRSQGSQSRGQVAQSNRPSWWTPGGGRGQGTPQGGGRGGGLPPRQSQDSSYDRFNDTEPIDKRDLPKEVVDRLEELGIEGDM
eukprot:5133676-Pleurochrysis_carterae.AAC.5